MQKNIFGNLKGDLVGGLTAGIVAMPLALAFGEQSGLGAQAGLVGAFMLGLFAAIFGGTATQISGPTAPMTVVSVTVIALMIDLPVEEKLSVIFLTFVAAGVFQILFGVLGIGKYVKYMPYPVLSGFMTAIGVMIILGELYPLIDVDLNAYLATNTEGVKATALNKLLYLPEAFFGALTTSYQPLLLGIGTIAIIYLFPRITKAIPSSLFALILMTSIAYFLKWEVTPVTSIEAGIPLPKLDILGHFNSSHLYTVLEYGLILAGLGAIDSLLTSVIADNITKTKHDSNKELIGQGIGNTLSGLYGGLPGAGATIRTVVNISSGGKTRLSGMTHALVLFIVLVVAGPYVDLIPRSVLAGILITVGIGVIDYKGLKHLFHVPRAEAVILIIVLLFAVFVGLVEGIAIGITFSALLFMVKAEEFNQANSTVSSISEFRREIPWMDEKGIFNEEEGNWDTVYVKHLYGALFFGFTAHFQEMVRNLPEVKIVIIRFERVPYIDQSGLYALEDAILDLEKRGIRVFLSGIQSQPLDMMSRLNIIPDLISEDHVFDTIDECAIYVKNELA